VTNCGLLISASYEFPVVVEAGSEMLTGDPFQVLPEMEMFTGLPFTFCVSSHAEMKPFAGYV
jgi:hypothetical protein